MLLFIFHKMRNVFEIKAIYLFYSKLTFQRFDISYLFFTFKLNVQSDKIQEKPFSRSRHREKGLSCDDNI